MLTLTSEEQAVVDVVREFVDDSVRPVARDLEHADSYPEELIDQMRYLGVFGLVIPPEYGGVGVSTTCFALVTEELARGWMSLAGAMGGHSVVARLLVSHGPEELRRRYLPRMATGELRATMALTEPGGGSDLQSMRTTAVRRGELYVVNGSKMWITNAERAGVTALMCKTDPEADPPYTGISILMCERGTGFSISRSLPKLGYKGVETCELSFDDYEVPVDMLLGGKEGEGFVQMMHGLELGRIQVAARAVGVAKAAFDAAIRYSQERMAFGKPIHQHQSIGNYLADMATKLSASRLLTLDAARALDEGRRCDLEAGMAKLFASEACMQICMDAMRIHGAYGYSTELDVERYFRDAPLMIIGEGTNEILRNLISKELVRRDGMDE